MRRAKRCPGTSARFPSRLPRDVKKKNGDRDDEKKPVRMREQTSGGGVKGCGLKREPKADQRDVERREIWPLPKSLIPLRVDVR